MREPGRTVKVLQVLGGFGMGGAETWLMEVLRLWSRTAAGQMDFLITSGEPGIFDEEARSLGANVYYVRYGRSNLANFTNEFRGILARGHYDAIHDHSDYASGWHFLFGLGKLPPVRIAHVHNPWLHIEANYAVNPARRLTAAAGKRLVKLLATNICGTSRESLQQYGFQVGQRGSPAVSVVHCGFDVKKFGGARASDRRSVLEEFGWPADAKIVLFVGRVDRALEFDHPQNHKNSWFALNVMRKAVEDDTSIHLVMAGAGTSREELERRVAEWGLETRLRLVGVRNDIPRLMRASDALFFPSRQEGLGMVAVEAQAAGLPVLASTAVPRECIVVPELYDALPLTDPVNLWVDALRRAFHRPRPSLEFCQEAIRSSAFSIGTSANRLAEIYSAAPA